MSATVDIQEEQQAVTKNWATNLRQHASGDKVIWALVVLLTLVSLLAVYSATGSLAYKNYKGNTEIYLFKQVIFILIGIGVIYFAHRVNYTIYSKVATFLFALTIPLLLYTLFFGVTMNEGSRWIRLPIINMTMQTSDLAKLALFMYLARVLSRKQDVIKDFKKGFLPLIIPVGLICVLIAPANLSTALLLGASCLMLLFIGRASVKHLLMVIGIACIPIVFLIVSAVVRHSASEEEVSAKKSGRIGYVGKMEYLGRKGREFYLWW
jgi:cell division protein FtsW